MTQSYKVIEENNNSLQNSFDLYEFEYRSTAVESNIPSYVMSNSNSQPYQDFIQYDNLLESSKMTSCLGESRETEVVQSTVERFRFRRFSKTRQDKFLVQPSFVSLLQSHVFYNYDHFKINRGFIV